MSPERSIAGRGRHRGIVDSSHIWQATLQACRAAGIDVMPLGVPLTDAALELLADAPPPRAVRAFADAWTQPKPNPWEAVTRSATIINPGTTVDAGKSGSAACLRDLVARSECAAVAYGQTQEWSSPDQWAYLLQLRQPQEKRLHLLLHPSAAAADVVGAEHTLNLALPPSYKDFLLLTNGLGFGPIEERYICGAGPARARWRPVQLNAWLECAGQHEIAAFWRTFQGQYAYERIRDRERGENSFLSDETALVPFAFTNAIWCFDRTHRDSTGEYPVVLWDAEVREARGGYPDFAAWFADQMATFVRRSA